MYFDIDYSLVEAKKLVLAPKLKQALEILKMNCQELNRYIEKQLEINPLLDVDDLEAEEGFEEDTEDEGFPVGYHSSRITLKDYLLLQLHVSGLNFKDKQIAEYLIENIDENGYLKTNIREAALYFKVPVSRIGRVLRKIQSFDPPGIGARNLKECLLIQISQLKGTDSDEYTVVRDYLDELAAGEKRKISGKTGISEKRLTDIAAFIKTLEPKPGREFFKSAEAKHVVCDIIVRKISNKLEALINEEAYPVLVINGYYSQMLKKDIGETVRNFIRDRMDSALWMIKCIEHRKNILRKIGQYIVNKRPDFFDQGKSKANQLLIRVLSSEIGIHETLMKKIMEGKYLQCRWGIFELAEFFR